MRAEVFEVLEKWAEYIGYDPNAREFKGTSWDYNVQKQMSNLLSLSEYDNTGSVQLVYASYMMNDVLNHKKLSYMDVITKPEEIAKLHAIWDVFQNPVVQETKRSFTSSVDKLVKTVMAGKVIGEYEPIEDEALSVLLSGLVEDLKKLRAEAYSKGDKSENLPLHPYIVVFPDLQSALKQLSSASNGVYLCYFDKGSGLLGWFGFFIKDGDNLVSYNERYDVAYPKQEGNMRNGRSISNSKADGIFPYDYIFSYSNVDYKGYAQTYSLDESKLALSNLSYAAYLPVILSMMLIRGHYYNNGEHLKLVYSMPLMLEYVKEQQGTAIVPINTALALSKVYKDTPMPLFDVAKSKQGEYAESMDRKGRQYNAYMTSNNINQDLVEVYATDFDENSLANSEAGANALSLIESADIVGTLERVEVFSYWQQRVALARHIEAKMAAEYAALGGKSGVLAWFDEAVKANLDALTVKVLCFDPKQSYIHKTNWGYSKREANINNMSVRRNHYPNMAYMGNHAINVVTPTRRREDAVCPITGTANTLVYTCELNSIGAFKALFGDLYDKIGIPSLLETWDEYREFSGNCILDMIDPVDMIRHPFKRDKLIFRFDIAFSKKGCLKFAKDHGIELDKFWLSEKTVE